MGSSERRLPATRVLKFSTLRWRLPCSIVKTIRPTGSSSVFTSKKTLYCSCAHHFDFVGQVRLTGLEQYEAGNRDPENAVVAHVPATSNNSSGADRRQQGNIAMIASETNTPEITKKKGGGGTSPSCKIILIQTNVSLFLSQTNVLSHLCRGRADMYRAHAALSMLRV